MYNYNTEYVPLNEKTGFSEWFLCYEYELTLLYKCMMLELNKRYETEITYDFKKFCKFCYNNSSKVLKE